MRTPNDREDLDRLLAEVDLGTVDLATDFEGIVAGSSAAIDAACSSGTSAALNSFNHVVRPPDLQS
jgi:hypothetical protein